MPRRLRDSFDITLPRFDLLAQLDRAPNGMTLGELSQRMMVSNGNITGLVDRLTEQGLVYRGRVGSGIGAQASRALTALVAPIGRADSPFDDEVPVIDARGTFWVEPLLVVDVETHGVGYTRLRQPSYRGVRQDLGPGDL